MTQRFLIDQPIVLPTVGTSGYITINLPYDAVYAAILNNSGADVALKDGLFTDKPSDVTPVGANSFLAMPTAIASKFTLFWTSQGALSTSNNKLLIKFSNEPIALSGGQTQSGGIASNVAVTNIPTVNIGGTASVTVTNTPSVTLAAGTALAGSMKITDGTNTAAITAAGEQKSSITQPLPTGGNAIGTVGVTSLPAGLAQDATVATLPKAATAGIASSNQVTLGTAAVAILNAAVTGKTVSIVNVDATLTIYIGASGVTTATGFPLLPGQAFGLDIISGSTINVYGIAASGAPKAAYVVVN